MAACACSCSISVTSLHTKISESINICTQYSVLGMRASNEYRQGYDKCRLMTKTAVKITKFCFFFRGGRGRGVGNGCQPRRSNITRQNAILTEQFTIFNLDIIFTSLVNKRLSMAKGTPFLCRKQPAIASVKHDAIWVARVANQKAGFGLFLPTWGASHKNKQNVIQMV